MQDGVASPRAAARSARRGGADAWSRYRDNLARHLIGVSRDLQARVMLRLGEEHGYARLRPSLGPFLSLVWTEGRRLNAIAAQLAISPQACSQLANLAERAGYLERKSDPRDRRAKLVMLSARGRALVEDAVVVILECESEYADRVGPTAYRRFTAALAALFEGLRLQVHPDRALGAVASRTIAVLPLLAVRIQQELQDAIAARGHRGLKTSHGPVLARIGPEGARIHEIARIQRVTRQAISAMSRELEELGYLRREADPRDGRGVLLRRTEHCTRLVRDSVAALAGLERSFLGIVGADGLAQLQRVARQLFEALHLEDELLHAAGARPAASTRPRAARGDMRALASSLRRRLDAPDVARLAALLEPRAKDAATRSGSAETSHRREASR